MKSFDYWDVVEEDYEVSMLLENPTMAQLKHHKEKKNQEGEGKDMPIYWGFLDDLHQDHDSQFT